MQNLKALFFTALAILFLSCNGNVTPSPTPTTIDIAVVNGSDSTIAAGATVSLYDSLKSVTRNIPSYKSVTDQSGKLRLTVSFLNQYFVIIQKGNESNYYGGLIPIGVFKSLAEIQESPAQAPAGVVGGVKFQDTNGDGRITSADEVAPPLLPMKIHTDNVLKTAIY